jgi:hypothetical protein
MTIEYETTLDDLDAYYRLVMASAQFRRAFRKRTGILTLSVAVIMFMLVQASSRNVTAAIIVAFVCALPVFFLYPSVLRHETTAASKRSIMADPATPALGHHTLEITSERVSETCSHQTLSVGWTAVRSVVRTAHHFFICLTNLSAFIIPLRSFTSPQAAQDFQDYLSQVIPPNVTTEFNHVA